MSACRTSRITPPTGQANFWSVAFYDYKQAARLLSVPPSTLWWWLEGRDNYVPVLPTCRPVTRRWLGGVREARYLAAYRRLDVPLQHIRRFIANLRDTTGAPFPLATIDRGRLRDSACCSQPARTATWSRSFGHLLRTGNGTAAPDAARPVVLGRRGVRRGQRSQCRRAAAASRPFVPGSDRPGPTGGAFQCPRHLDARR